MEGSMENTSFSLPLELQFAMCKAEMQANEMTWEQLHEALLSLYYRRLMEWQTIKALMADENIKIDYDMPTEMELMELAVNCLMEENDEEEGSQPF
tara:strand:+ start:5777 stop:6064 length:288 start_codon:yes stop_codon:yes gene_type:complete